MGYKDSPVLSEVAEALRVNIVLTGCVMRADDRVRITEQALAWLCGPARLPPGSVAAAIWEIVDDELPEPFRNVTVKRLTKRHV